MVFGDKRAMRSCLAAVLALVAIPASAQEKITLTFANWADAEQATRPGIQAMIAEYEKTHPSIKIESQAIAFSEIARQLVLRVRSGNSPDVAELQGNDTILLALTGKLEPLDAYLGEGGLGAFIIEGINRDFRTPLVVGSACSVALAVVADVGLAGVARLLSPWSRPGNR